MKLTVLGAGCWGLTLAWLLTGNFDEITVWGRAQDLTEELIKNKHCSKPLEVQLADKVEITSDLKSAIDGAEIILSVVATSGTRDVCEQLKKAGIKPEQILVNASKGIELPSLKRMSEVIRDVLPEQKLVTLSGPTLAKEVLQGKPTAASVACEDIKTAEFVQKACTVPNKFRLYTNTDVIGVELGGVHPRLLVQLRVPPADYQRVHVVHTQDVPHRPPYVGFEVHPERDLLPAQDLAEAQRGHLHLVDPAGHGLRDALHDVVRLAAGYHVHPLVGAGLEPPPVHGGLQ